MTIERAFRVSHNLDVPVAKRRHWPQWSVVVVREASDVPDVIQFFEHPKEEEQLRCLEDYPRSISFTVKAGEWVTSLEEFEKRVKDTAELCVKLLKK
jgi:hypothetical protein